MRKIPSLAFLLLFFALLIFLQPAQASEAEFISDLPVPLSKGDAMLIRIENVGGGIPEYREIVDSDGNIKLPFLGLLFAAGNTTDTLAIQIAEAYAAARLSTNAAIQIKVVNHFEPPPDRANLVRTGDPRRPVPVSDTPLSSPLPAR